MWVDFYSGHFSRNSTKYREILSERYPNDVIDDDFIEEHTEELQEIMDKERDDNGSDEEYDWSDHFF